MLPSNKTARELAVLAAILRLRVAELIIGRASVRP